MKRTGRKNRIIPDEELPNKARILRLQRGYSLQQLADIINVNLQTLSAYELRGEGGRSFVYALADHFQIDPRELESPGKKFRKKFSGKLRHLT